MSLTEADRDRIVAELGREPTPAEAALFENLWSEHCAYRSSRPLLGAFETTGDRVVLGPGDDAAVVELPSPGELPPGSTGEADTDPGGGSDSDAGDGSDAAEADRPHLVMGVESHNHPSYVDPYDGAATGVGGIVRDVLSMGAYPIALADSLYFGAFDREHSRYLLEGVVEGIADYGNAIGVPTVAGSVDFHPDYEGNPLVNVGCVGLVSPDRLVTATATTPGNKLVLVGNATGRDGLGGASFASEDLDEDSETEDRPAVQVGDPYTEKLLIEASETLLDRDLVEAARDLGAAGLGGATAEMAAKGGLGADIDLDAVHQREPGMNAVEILLAESQERMCYEVRPENVEAVREVADRYDLGSSVVGELTRGNYVCRFDGERVVDAPPRFLADGAPLADLDRTEPGQPEPELPDADLREAFESVLASPTTASKRWVYRQYDHEVGARTARRPGDDAAVMAIREAAPDAVRGETPPTDGSGVGLALSSGAVGRWTACAPCEGARAVALENAANLAAVGARPLAAVDCLNGGNPEKPDVYGAFAAVVDGLAGMCSDLGVPVVGGNVSLYNDSPSGAIPPTPTLVMVGARRGYDAPGIGAVPDADLVLVGRHGSRLGGSEYLAHAGGTDRFPTLPDDPQERVEALARVANHDATLAVHDVSNGGLAVALAEMVGDAGLSVELPGEDPAGELFGEAPGRAVVATTDPDGVRDVVGDAAPVHSLGTGVDDSALDLSVGERSLRYDGEEIERLRGVLARELD